MLKSVQICNQVLLYIIAQLRKLSVRSIGYSAYFRKSSFDISLLLKLISCRVSAITVEKGIILEICLFSRLIISSTSHLPEMHPRLSIRLSLGRILSAVLY